MNDTSTALKHALEQNLHLTSKYLSGFKMYLICKGKMPFGFPEENLGMCSVDHKESKKCSPVFSL